MKKYILILLILFLCISIVNNKLTAQNSLPYFGQTPPGTVAERFGSTFLLSDNSWTWFGAPVFSLDGREMYFVKYDYTSNDVKMEFTEDIDGVWTTPQTPVFVENTRTESPFFFKDNSKLYIIKDLSGTNEPKIYTVERNTEGWNPAQLVEMPYNDALGDISNFSITNDSTIYFTLHTDLGAYIYKSRRMNGQYAEFEKLPNQINSFNSSSPYIAPDESYIIFESDRSGSFGVSDLYVSFKDNEDNWTIAVNLGENINSSSYEYGASVSYDGKHLFFCSKRNDDINYNAYWVDISVVEELNPFTEIEKVNQSIENCLQIYPNPATDKISLKFQKNQEYNIAIYNVLGEIVIEDKLNEISNEIDVSALLKGIYIVRISNSNFEMSKKFVKD